MKKLLFFVVTIAITILCSIKVDASTSFYEGEYITGIYMNKQQAGSSTIYYQKARFFRQTGTNQFAYCIDPFVFFRIGSTYEEAITPEHLTQEQIEKISQIAYFGYGYKNHTETKWYAITQFMIWQIADPTGTFYFTDGLNGPKIDIFTEEMKEINQLVENYRKNTSLNNKTYTLLEGETLSIIDTNNVISNYKIDNTNFTITENKLTTKPLQEGIYNITLTREENNYNKPILFYQSERSQALMQTGDLKNKIEKLKVEVLKTSLEITKIDSDTQSTTPSGEGSLIGAEYGLYNESNELITTIKIEEDSKGKIENIPFGTYYLKELKAPTGYQLDTKVYTIYITKENPKIEITLENKIIKKKIIIYKTYDEDKKIKEANISFTIYDKNNQKVATVTTNEEGKAEIILPYGEYKIIQENTTEGYQKVDDITISVKDLKEEIISLTDYKIKVPNTHTNIFIRIINIIIKLLSNIW